MKKVLIIAYYWRGRMPGLAKYLPEFGWQPIILTAPSPLDQPPPPELRVIETYCSPVLGFWKKRLGFNQFNYVGSHSKNRFNISHEMSLYPLLRWAYKNLQTIINYPDAERGWTTFAVNAGNDILQNEDISAIISSSSPVTSHIIAKELKNKHEIQWVADLRDLWTQNHNYHYNDIRKFFEQRLELETLQLTDALVTVSSPWAEMLRTLHKGKQIYAITNGFDAEKFSTGLVNLTSKFTITYTGLIYNGRQDPSKLLAALQDLISDGTMNPTDVAVRFYGPVNERLLREIERYGLSDIIRYYGMVPQETVFEKQRESQLLILLNWGVRLEDGQESGCYPLKIFEYLGAQRPILATGGAGNDVVKELLDETKAGIYAKQIEDIKRILKELYLEYKLNGKISYNGDIEKINKYTHREMARKFAEILDNLTQKDYGTDN